MQELQPRRDRQEVVLLELQPLVPLQKALAAFLRWPRLLLRGRLLEVQSLEEQLLQPEPDLRVFVQDLLAPPRHQSFAQGVD